MLWRGLWVASDDTLGKDVAHPWPRAVELLLPAASPLHPVVPEARSAGPHPLVTRGRTLAHAVTYDVIAGMAREVDVLIAQSVAYNPSNRFGLDLSLRSADDVDHWIDDPAAFRAGMAIIHDAAASLIDAVAPALAAGAPLTS